MPIETLDGKAAHDAMAGGAHVFVDVRTVEEYEAGHPAGALNVPWALRDPATGGMAPNADFLPTMRKHFAPDGRIFLSCQAGMRSLNACRELERAGFARLVNVDGGFGGRRDASGRVVVKGWAECGLPVARTPSTYGQLAGR